MWNRRSSAGLTAAIANAFESILANAVRICGAKMGRVFCLDSIRD
jgi:hypothetical protein